MSSSLSKTPIAVLFGGRSVEHEISIISGLEMIAAVDTFKYQVVPVYIAQNGRWFTGEELLDRTFYKKLPNALSQLTEVTLLPIPDVGGLKILKRPSSGMFGMLKRETDVIPIEVYFPVFHGQFGEDGSIQGLFEMACVPYASSGVMASALAMNKYACKMLLSAHGIPVLPSVLIEKEKALKDLGTTRDYILSSPSLSQYPLFVKPNNLGSSIGVSRANNQAELDQAIAKAFKFDTQLLVEPCLVEKFEINVSVLGEATPTASVVEIPVTQSDSGTLTFEDKYMHGGKGKKAPGAQALGMAGLTRVINPEHLPGDMKEDVRRFALKAFQILECSGISRFDFIVDSNTNTAYFNELNPIPGSLAHYLWSASQPPLLYTEILDRAIVRAQQIAQAKTSLQRDTGFKALFQ